MAITLDHVSLNVSDAARANQFYTKALQPLGYRLFKEYDDGVGVEGESSVWTQQANVEKPRRPSFRAEDHGQVDAFYKSAWAAGGKDNGKPGIRQQYASDHYAAFVLDPDRNNVEAVRHSSIKRSN